MEKEGCLHDLSGVVKSARTLTPAFSTYCSGSWTTRESFARFSPAALYIPSVPGLWTPCPCKSKVQAVAWDIACEYAFTDKLSLIIRYFGRGGKDPLAAVLLMFAAIRSMAHPFKLVDSPDKLGLALSLMMPCQHSLSDPNVGAQIEIENSRTVLKLCALRTIDKGETLTAIYPGRVLL